MAGDLTVAIAGDSIIARRVSVFAEDGFLRLVKIVRDADVAYTHLETLIHDYEGPEVYPAAESGWTWMRSPRYVADELRWFGFDIVSTACNHSLDYSYGGLYATWEALRQAHLAYAGTGRSLGEARAPAYLDTAKGRIALISMSSSFASWARAGEARCDMAGRPGLNPLRYHYVVDSETLDAMRGLAVRLGWWVRNVGKEWLFHPAGLHHAILRFQEGTEAGVSTAVHEGDAEGNLRSIRDARRRAERVLVHLHNHEWDPQQDLSAPPAFARSFARACIDAGADIVIGSGSHALLRGIELYRDRPIFYDPGDFMHMTDTVSRLPADAYRSLGMPPELGDPHALPGDVFEARRHLPAPLNPPGGYHSARVPGSVVAVCSFGDGGGLKQIKLYPVTMTGGPPSQSGRPLLAGAETGRRIIDYLAELSAPYGTELSFEDGAGIVALGAP